jgi:hypothetical protein
MSLHRRTTHPEFVEGCFGCKVSTLQMNPGDAAGNKIVSNKKWNAELNAYANARAQGIQPDGTSMKKIEAAVKASENMGTAYDGGTAVASAQRLQDKKTVKSLKETGVI